MRAIARRVAWFWSELRRRNVLSVAATYLIAVWGLSLGASELLPTFDVPPWAVRGVIILLMMGLPVADEIDYTQARGPSGAIDITPPPASSPLAAVTQAMDALLDNVEQEADSNAPAVSDADPVPPAAAQEAAPTGALPQELAERARAIVTAIRKAQTAKDIDRVLLAQRGNLDDISAASPEAHERIMEESRRRVAEVAG